MVKLDRSDLVFASLVGEGADGASPAKDQPGALDMIIHIRACLGDNVL